MATLLDLKTEVRNLLNEPYVSGALPARPFFSDSEITRWINEAQDDLLEETDINYQHVEYAVVSAVDSLALSTINPNADLLKLHGAIYHDVDDEDDTWYNLDTVSPLFLKLLNDDASAKQFIAIYNDTLYFNNTLAVGDKVLIEGRWSVAELSADTDTFALNRACRMAVVYRAVANGHWKKAMNQENPFALYWEQKYTAKMEKIKQYTTNLVAERLPSGLSSIKNEGNLGKYGRNRRITGA